MGETEKRYKWEVRSGWVVGVSRGTPNMVKMSESSPSCGGSERVSGSERPGQKPQSRNHQGRNWVSGKSRGSPSWRGSGKQGSSTQGRVPPPASLSRRTSPSLSSQSEHCLPGSLPASSSLPALAWPPPPTHLLILSHCRVGGGVLLPRPQPIQGHPALHGGRGW